MRDRWISRKPRWSEDLHFKVEQELTRLIEATEETLDTPSGWPFCGCLTCQVREVLAMVVDATADALDEGSLVRVEGLPRDLI